MITLANCRPVMMVAVTVLLSMLGTVSANADIRELGRWEGGLDARAKSELLARHNNSIVDFNCEPVSVQLYSDGTALLPPSFSCAITITATKSTGITWSKRTYRIAYKAPLENRKVADLRVTQRLWSEWQYTERGRTARRETPARETTLPVRLSRDGQDIVLRLANGVAGVIADVPWRLVGGSGRETGGNTGGVHRNPDPTPPRRPPGPDDNNDDNNNVTGMAGAGPYHEFAALCRMGWASALARYSVGPADDSIIGHLDMAGAHMRIANQTTFDPLRAWPNWRGQGNQLDQMALNLRQQRGHYRKYLSSELSQYGHVLSDSLANQMAGDVYHIANCDSHYAWLGFQLCYGQQALQIAEAAERQSDRIMTRDASRDGWNHLFTARREIDALPSTRLASGSCLDLSRVNAILDRTSMDNALWEQVGTVNQTFQTALVMLGGQAGQRAVRRQPVPAFLAGTDPNPRRVGQRYTFTLAVDNPTMTPIMVSSVGAETWIDGRLMAGGSDTYFNPRTHGGGRGWRTSIAQPGERTIIYQGSAVTSAEHVGEWRTRLTFHTNLGDFVVETVTRVFR